MLSNVGSSNVLTMDMEVVGDPPQLTSVWQLLKLNKSQWKYGILGIIGSIITSLMIPSLAFLTANVLSEYYDYDHSHMKMMIQKTCIKLVVLGGVSMFGCFIQYCFFGIMGENLIEHIREMMLASKSPTPLYIGVLMMSQFVFLNDIFWQ